MIWFILGIFFSGGLAIIFDDVPPLQIMFTSLGLILFIPLVQLLKYDYGWGEAWAVIICLIILFGGAVIGDKIFNIGE